MTVRPRRRGAQVGVRQSLRRSAWAKEFCDAQRGRGKNHHAALRALGNRWLEVLWHCLTNDMPYDETVHIANRNRALATG